MRNPGRRHPSEAERIAMSLAISHGTVKEHMIMKYSGLPDEAIDAVMQSDAPITKGKLGAMCIEFFFLYDKCAKAGLVDSSSVDAAFLASMRETIDMVRREKLDLLHQSSEEALEEMHIIMEYVVKHLDAERPKMPEAADVIKKARSE